MEVEELVGTLADQTSLKAALGVVPAMLLLAAVALALVWRARTAHHRPDKAAAEMSH